MCHARGISRRCLRRILVGNACACRLVCLSDEKRLVMVMLGVYHDVGVGECTRTSHKPVSCACACCVRVVCAHACACACAFAYFSL